MCEELVQEALGQICWLEIPVQNVSRAKNFYTELFEWEFNSEPQMPVGNCVKGMHFFNKGKTLHGAFLEHDEAFHVINHDPARPGAMPLLPTLCVLDCQETLDRAIAIGGKTAISDGVPSPKTEIGGDMGFFARVIDPEGNMIGLWSNK
ncbi:unnamed protein product [Fusarium equiseti]|uniref:Glyoxalase/Bleomycin resistance-like N-terminal domain-containing protein n=1 Tax=Fusarium equiseti TaxID=61235 RepID=A0A8J2IRT4_FUSEQ|nr:unnamed protein product [Fusarium equiseti]